MRGYIFCKRRVGKRKKKKRGKRGVKGDRCMEPSD